jgi:hypothetical protein
VGRNHWVGVDRCRIARVALRQAQGDSSDGDVMLSLSKHRMWVSMRYRKLQSFQTKNGRTKKMGKSGFIIKKVLYLRNKR